MAVGLSGVHVAQAGACGCDVVCLVGNVLDGCHGQDIVVCAGRTQNAVIGVLGLVSVGAPVVHETGLVVVTGGDGQNNVGLSDAVVELAHGRGGLVIVACAGEACGGTQGQVDDIGTQHHGVFQSSQDVSVVCTAVAAEDLHGHQLCVTGNAHSLGALHLIGGGDTGNVSAVVALGVVVVGVVGVGVTVVETEDDLAVGVDVVDGQTSVQAGSVQAAQNGLHVCLGHVGLNGCIQSLEVLVILVNTGVDDSNDHALAGEAGIPGGLTADHDAVVVGQHIGCGDLVLADLIAALQQDLLDALDLLDGSDAAVGDLGGDCVQQPGVGIADLQLLTFQDVLLDGGDDLGLSGLQVSSHLHGLFVDHSSSVLLDDGLLLHDNDDLDGLVIGDGVGNQALLGFAGLLGQVDVDVSAAELFDSQLQGAGLVLHGENAHGAQGQHQGQGQQGSQELSHLLHALPSFLPLTITVTTAAMPATQTRDSATSRVMLVLSPVPGRLEPGFLLPAGLVVGA